jgi:hypothetical protein
MFGSVAYLNYLTNYLTLAGAHEDQATRRG